MVCSNSGGRARVAILLLCAAIIPSCGGGNSSGTGSPSKGGANPSVSQQGRFVVFETTSGTERQVVLIDRVNATSQVVAVGEDINHTVVSPDGRFVAFDSRPPGSSFRQVFLSDLTANVTTPVSVASGGLFGNGDSTNPSISDDGRFVAFQSTAVSLGARSATSTSILLRDMSSDTIQLASGATPSADVNPVVSGNGQFVAFESRPETGFSTVLMFNRLNNQLAEVSSAPGGATPDGASGNPSVSFDGRMVAFESRATNLTPASPETGFFRGESNILVRDVLTGGLFVASVPVTPGVPADGDSHHPSISADGQRVAFDSTATNLTADAVVPGTSNVFVRDLNAQTTTLVTAPATPTTPVPVTPTTTTPVPAGADQGISTGTPVQPISPTTGVVTGTPTQPTTPTTPVVTGTPTQPTGTATSGVTGTPAQPTGTSSGLVTSTPTLPTATESGLVTSTPVQPTATGSGLVTSTPVQPTGMASGLSTSTPVQPTGTASGLVTSTPVVPTTTTVPTPVVTTGTGVTIVATGAVSTGSVHPRISADGAWVVFESRGRILLANLGTGEISTMR